MCLEKQRKPVWEREEKDIGYEQREAIKVLICLTLEKKDREKLPGFLMTSHSASGSATP